MKRLRLLTACLAISLVSCNEQLIEQSGPASGETGRVLINLSSDTTNDFVDVKAADGETVPEDDFWIEIFTSGKTRIYCEKYVDAKNDVIDLNTGDYRLLATYGNPAGVGFDHAYYVADKNFKVEPKKDNSVEAVAKLGNVKAKVVFDENILNTNFYSNCYATLKNSKYKTPLKFKKNETRAGFIPGGKLTFSVYVTLNGKLMYYALPEETYEPNDFVTFTIKNTPEQFGNLVVSVKVENALEEKTYDVEIPGENAYPADLPVIEARQFVDGAYTIVEGDRAADSDLEMSIVADGELQSILLDVQSEAFDLPAGIDLMNLDDETKAKLENAGFVWYISSLNKAAVIDFESVATTIAQEMPYNGPDDEIEKTSTFTVTVVDKLNHVETETVAINWEIGAISTVTAEDYDIWATKIVNPTVNFTKGNPSASVLMYRVDDEQEWISLGAPKSVSGMTAVFDTATGLEPGKPCQFMVVHQGFSPRGEGSIVTEEAQQIPNSDFEFWYEDDHKYTTPGEYTRKWYRPAVDNNGNVADSWWDVNSKKTMPATTTEQYREFKMVPTVYYSYDNPEKVEGNRSAQLITTYVNTMASDLSYGAGIWNGTSHMAAGEIFIGKSDENGEQSVQGHEFSSRPSSLSFRYKYLAYNDDGFRVYLYVEDEAGEKIAEETYIGGTNSPSWSRDPLTIDINYTVGNRKAARIYISIRSSKASDEAVTYRRVNFDQLDNMTVVGDGAQKGLIGSVLFIDDLKLNY